VGLEAGDGQAFSVRGTYDSQSNEFVVTGLGADLLLGYDQDSNTLSTQTEYVVLLNNTALTQADFVAV
jgi:hypothetical protein